MKSKASVQAQTEKWQRWERTVRLPARKESRKPILLAILNPKAPRPKKRRGQDLSLRHLSPPLPASLAHRALPRLLRHRLRQPLLPVAAHRSRQALATERDCAR